MEEKLLESADEIFATAAERKAKDHKNCTEDDLMKKIGRLEVENDFLRQAEKYAISKGDWTLIAGWYKRYLHDSVEALRCADHASESE